MKQSFLLIASPAIGFSFILCLLASGCSSLAPQSKKGLAPLAPPSNLGVSISPAGDAVAEVDSTPDQVFKAAETYFRKRCKITFINYSIYQLDAEEKGRLFAVKINDLTSGKTGICLRITEGEKDRPNSDLARKMANELLHTLPRYSSGQ